MFKSFLQDDLEIERSFFQIFRELKCRTTEPAESARVNDWRVCFGPSVLQLLIHFPRQTATWKWGLHRSHAHSLVHHLYRSKLESNKDFDTDLANKTVSNGRMGMGIVILYLCLFKRKYMFGAQMTLVLIIERLLLEGWISKIENKQVAGIYLAIPRIHSSHPTK